MKHLLPPALSVLCALLLVGSGARAMPSVTKIGDTVVDAQALTIATFNRINGLSFQQDAVVTHNGWQYVTYYNAARHVCLSRRQLPSDSWQKLELLDYTMYGDDAHDVISMGVCPNDGTIHLAFDHHGHPLHYRVSQKGAASDPKRITWDASIFGPITSELEKGRPIRITYPRFWQAPDGDLQFCYRQGASGNGDRMLVDYNAETGTWGNTRQIDSREGLFEDSLGQSRSRCSYPNGYDYGPEGKLHVTWVWRESSQGSNHDLMYAYSANRGRTWLNNEGQPLSEPAHVDSPGIAVARISRAHGLMNTHGQAVDSQGRIHVVMWHCSDKSYAYAASLGYAETRRWGHATARRYNHYWRDTKGTWHHYEMPWISGNRPKLFIRANDNAFLIYKAVPDPKALGYKTVVSGGDLTIAAATADSDWTDWRIIHTEPGPFVNDMLGDPYRFKNEEVLSVLVQGNPTYNREPTPLRILDFQLK